MGYHLSFNDQTVLANPSQGGVVSRRFQRASVCCLVTVMLFAGLSCSRQPKGIYPVSGTVTYNGSPATGAAVFFHRHDPGPQNEQVVMGIVKENGAFELVCGSLGKGAPPGDYDVVIEWKEVSGQSKGGPQRGPDRLGGRYADPKQTPLHATVKAGPNQLAAFDLTDG